MGLNENLLDDVAIVAGMTETLSHYFAENINREVSDGVLWGCLKQVCWALLSLGELRERRRGRQTS